MATDSINLTDMGSGGLNLDQPPFSLKQGEWNRAINVAMRDGKIRSAPGLSDIVQCDPDMEVRHMLPFSVGNVHFWNEAGISAGAGAMCLTDGTAGRDVTPAVTPLIANGDQWTGGTLNSVPLLCNGQANVPWYLPEPENLGIWTPLPFTITPGDPPTVDETWATKNITAAVLRPFKNFMFALSISRDAGFFPHLLMWSDAADPGAVPRWQDWESLDPTNLGGEVSIGEGTGGLVDAVPLHDLLMIYKEDSIWTADLVGGIDVFRFRKAITSIGALSTNCVAPFKRGHVVLGDGDVILHNGTSAESIVADRMRRYLFRVIDSDNFRNSFVTIDYEHQEVWVCFPLEGATYPNVAIVWNWRHNTWVVRDLPDFTFSIAIGLDNFGIALESDAWGADANEPDIEGDPTSDPEVPYIPAVWGGDDGVPIPYLRPWGSRSFNPTLRAMIGCWSDNPGDPTEKGIFKIDDDAVGWFGVPVTQSVERIGIPLLDQDRRFIVRRVFPMLEASGPIDFYFGYQEWPTDPVNWQGPYSFNPNSESFMNPLLSGRLLAIRIQDDVGTAFTFHGMKISFTPGGTQ